jgi:hypothetical protein
MLVIDLDRLRKRQDTYLTTHYLNLHAMVVSIALGLGVIAAGPIVSSWFTHPANGFRLNLVYTIMLATSFLLVVVVYSGPLHGAIFLPAGIPSVLDLLIPLIVGLSEFALFGVLASSATDWSTPKTIIASWWAAAGVLGVGGAVQILRARYLIRRTAYSPDAQPLQHAYVKRLTQQAIGAGSNGVLGFALAGLAIARFDELNVLVHGIAAGALLTFLIGAMQGHKTTARIIRRALAIADNAIDR